MSAPMDSTEKMMSPAIVPVAVHDWLVVSLATCWVVPPLATLSARATRWKYERVNQPVHRSSLAKCVRAVVDAGEVHACR